MNDQVVFVRDIADRMGVDRSGVRRLVKRFGLTVLKRRGPETGMQLASALSEEDAEKLMAWRDAAGFSAETNGAGTAPNFLYAVEVDPERRPGRVKVGTATIPENRFADYRTVCPDMNALRVWPVPSSCEGYLIALAGKFGERVGMELFDMGPALVDFLTVADEAFRVFADQDDDEAH
jgi:hypothetical protein